MLFKRAGMETWQFPQGGIDPGESPGQALYREVEEETGCGDFRVLSQGESPVSYDFPGTLKTNISKNYRGQKQHWFLCQFNEGAGPDLEKAEDKEFDDFRWADLKEVLTGIVIWKKSAYEQGLKELGLSTLK